MTILKQPKKRKIKYYFGKCKYCEAEFKIADYETSIGDLYDKYKRYIYCPFKECSGRNVKILVFSNKKHFQNKI